MLRVYAMYSRNKLMLAFWISACLVLVGMAVVGDFSFAFLMTSANLTWISGQFLQMSRYLTSTSLLRYGTTEGSVSSPLQES